MAAFGGINEALPSRADVREDFLVAPVAPFPHRGRLIQWKNHSTSHQATDSRFASASASLGGTRNLQSRETDPDRPLCRFLTGIVGVIWTSSENSTDLCVSLFPTLVALSKTSRSSSAGSHATRWSGSR
jgi:hypothetical protein